MDDVVLDMAYKSLVAEHGAQGDGIELVRRKRLPSQEVLAFAFVTQNGRRLAVLGYQMQSDGRWVGRAQFAGPASTTDPGDGRESAWSLWGGWAPHRTPSSMAVFAGWVSDPRVRQVRLTDTSGNVVEDTIEGGVVILMQSDPFHYESGMLQFLDFSGEVLSAGSLPR